MSDPSPAERIQQTLRKCSHMLTMKVDDFEAKYYPKAGLPTILHEIAEAQAPLDAPVAYSGDLKEVAEERLRQDVWEWWLMGGGANISIPIRTSDEAIDAITKGAQHVLSLAPAPAQPQRQMPSVDQIMGVVRQWLVECPLEDTIGMRSWARLNDPRDNSIAGTDLKHRLSALFNKI